MFRWMTLALIVISVTAAVTLVAYYVPDPPIRPVNVVAEPKGPPPVLEIEGPNVYDFGIMPTTDKGKHSWTIKNKGEGDLELTLRGTSCSCTIAKFKTKQGEPEPVVVVKPAESTTIELEWETKQFAGAYAKHAMINSNDPKRLSFQLNVKGAVYSPVLVFPPEMIRFEAIPNDEANRAHVAVYSMDRTLTKVTKVSSTRPEYVVPKASPLSEEERKQYNIKSGGYRLDVEIKPGMPIESFNEEILVETDHPLMPQLKVSVAGRTVGPVSVVPTSLRLTNVSSKNGVTGELAVLVRGDRPIKFEVERKPAAVEVKIERSQTKNQAGRYNLRVIVPPGTQPGTIDETMIIKTDHPFAREIKVPIKILVSSVSEG
jgi:hypothetical protein